MSVPDEIPERDTLPQFCPVCNGVISQKWDNDVTDPAKTRKEGYECLDCSWVCQIKRPPVEVRE
jgi:hypothetical protein